MRTIMEALLAAQRIELQSTKPTPDQASELARLRSLAPAPILGHYDRLIVRGKKGVALVRNGVCSECHMRLPIAEVADLIIANEVHLCSSCGRYLLPAPEEPAPPAAVIPAKHPRVGRPRKKKTAA